MVLTSEPMSYIGIVGIDFAGLEGAENRVGALDVDDEERLHVAGRLLPVALVLREFIGFARRVVAGRRPTDPCRSRPAL